MWQNATSIRNCMRFPFPRQTRFKGYDGASEGPFSLFERSLELLGRLMAASLLVFPINFDVEVYFLVLSWPLDASWADFCGFVSLWGRFWDPRRVDFGDFSRVFRYSWPVRSKM